MANKAKHTPGPWIVFPEVHGSHPDHLVYISVGPKGRRTCAVSVYGAKTKDGETADKRTIPEDETRANARLIAAVPTLFDAAEVASDALRIAAETICVNPDHNVAAMACIELARRELEAAITKATA